MLLIRWEIYGSLFYGGVYITLFIFLDFLLRTEYLKSLFDFFGCLFLFIIIVKYNWCILYASIINLSVQGRRIMESEEMLNYLLMRCLSAIVKQMKYLDMSGLILAYVFIGRAFFYIWVGVHKTDRCGQNASRVCLGKVFSEKFLCAPEAAGSKGYKFNLIVGQNIPFGRISLNITLFALPRFHNLRAVHLL